VRISNWVEEKFGQEAVGNGQKLKDFMKKQEASDIAAATAAGDWAKAMRVEPKMGVPGDMLFSHGKEFAEKFGASMTYLHFTDPSSREYGAASDDRVHKSFFYGSKHIDAFVPKVEPNPRLALTSSKQVQWQQQMAPMRPTSGDMYATMNSVMYPGK